MNADKLSLLKWFSIKSEQTLATIRCEVASILAGRDFASKFTGEIEEEGRFIDSRVGVGLRSSHHRYPPAIRMPIKRHWAGL
jgi:hypothetical protein